MSQTRKSNMGRHLGQYGAAYLVLLISLTPVLIVWHQVRTYVQEREQARFFQIVNESQREMSQKLRHHLAALLATRGYFQASDDIDSEEWTRYLANLDLPTRYPAYGAVGYARRIPEAEKSIFENSLKAAGATNYSLAKPLENIDYYPLVLISPEDYIPTKNQPLNLSAVPEILPTLELALKSGKPEATPLIKLASGIDRQPQSFFLIILPVYSPKSSGGQKQVEGVVTGVMPANLLFKSLMDEVHSEWLALSFEEELAGGNKVTFFQSQPGPDIIPEGIDEIFETIQPFAFAGRNWTISARVRPAFFENSEKYVSSLTLVGGLLVTAALFGITWGQVRARSLAENLSKTLAESQERFRLVNRATNDAVYDWDVPHNRLTWNEAMALSFNYAPEKIEPTLEWWEDKVHPLDRVRVVRGLESALKKGGEFWADEYRFRKGNGSYATVIDRGYIMRDAAGNVIRMIGSMMDITDRKKAEDARFKSEQKLKLHFQQTPLAVVEWNLAFEVVDWNPGAEKTFGYTAEEALGRHAAELIVPEASRRHVNEVWQSLLLANKFGQRSTNQNRTKDGRVIVCDWYNTPVIDREGRVISVISLAMDVTEQRHVADALAEEKELLTVTLRSIGEGVVATDTSQNVVLINRVAEHMLHCHEKDVLGEPISSFLKLQHLKSGEMVENPVTKVLKATEKPEFKNQQALLVGVPIERRISYSCSPIYSGEGHIIGSVLVFRDVTEETRTAEELLRASKLESLGILAGGIAHDFNNILTVIIGNISIAKMQSPKGNVAYHRLEEAEKAGMRARDLTLQLLTFAKGGAPIKQTASVAELIRETVEFVLHGAKVQCEFDLAQDLLPVEVDEGQISQVMDNLIINAVQAMPSGGHIKVSASNITLDANSGVHLNPGRYIQISVQDSGTGIPTEILPKIFDPYFTTKPSGTGLGLATSYSIIRNHNGLMTVQSAKGEGTTFKIYLPASDKSIRTANIETDIISSHHGRVLVMDDDFRIRDLLKSMVEALGYEVETTSNGQEAINTYEQALNSGKRFDALIMDLTIPGGMGGKEAVDRIKQIDNNARAIVSSGYSNDPIMANHQANGFVGVLSKPYKIQDLARVLDNAIRNGHTKTPPKL